MASVNLVEYKPLIGITTARHIRSNGMVFNTAYQANARAVEAAGGLPLMIPCELHEDTLRSIYKRLDGVLLPGGGDVDPVTYGAEAHPTTGSIDSFRDSAEMNIARWAADEGVPLFAICRGQQVVNVALGGTLLQDISSLVDTDLEHLNRIPRDLLVHNVKIIESSQIYEIVGATSIQVNSIHHQAIDRLADSLTSTSYSPDGLIESVELADHPHYIAVQWHPEDLQDMPEMRNLYNNLVIAAKQYALARQPS